METIQYLQMKNTKLLLYKEPLTQVLPQSNTESSSRDSIRITNRSHFKDVSRAVLTIWSLETDNLGLDPTSANFKLGATGQVIWPSGPHTF